MPELTPEQKKLIDAKIEKEGLNEFGDPKDAVYMGGTPLFNEMTGDMLDRYQYIADKHPDWLPQSKS